MARRLLCSAQSDSLARHLDQAAALQALCHTTEDHREALDAMAEKRDPGFSGR